jgi:hypothetical protein
VVRHASNVRRRRCHSEMGLLTDRATTRSPHSRRKISISMWPSAELHCERCASDRRIDATFGDAPSFGSRCRGHGNSAANTHNAKPMARCAFSCATEMRRARRTSLAASQRGIGMATPDSSHVRNCTPGCCTAGNFTRVCQHTVRRWLLVVASALLYFRAGPANRSVEFKKS